MFRFRTDDITKTAIAGYTVAEAPDAFEKIGDGEWLFTLPQTLGVLDFDTARTVELTYDGTTVQTLIYSLNAYAYAVGQKIDTDGNLTAGALLARAAYTFGVRAEAYAAD